VSAPTVVIPTLGRPTLAALLASLPGLDVIVVDDRRDQSVPLALPPGTRALSGTGKGPAAARNLGWRAAGGDWVVFLDDDVLPGPGWAEALAADLESCGPAVGGVQGNLRVPLPPGRRPTDWERATAALADGRWLTADMAYRTAALRESGGFDERFPRAFREDAELAFRVRRKGWTLQRGSRSTTHPVRAEGPWVSLRTQRGNADDALLRRLYGRDWRSRLEIPPGRRVRHTLITAAGLVALASGPRRWTRLAAAVWALGTAEFVVARVRPGPAELREVATMLATSVVIPPLAVGHWLRGWWRWRGIAG
jgi:cellulose synthase/poly-beta-1,6-N-acetylglucosamine synthase-like glycosyltransferase